MGASWFFDEDGTGLFWPDKETNIPLAVTWSRDGDTITVQAVAEQLSLEDQCQDLAA
jgi:hypothetical protein